MCFATQDFATQGPFKRFYRDLPWRAVTDGKDPASYDDLLGSGQGADELGLDGVTDGDVPLDREGR